MALGDDFRRWAHTALAPRPTLRSTDVLRNAVCGVAAAGLGGFADTLLLPSVVVAAFVARVGGGYDLVALVPVVGAVAWWLPGLIAGHAVAHHARVVPLAAAATLLWAILAGGVALFAGSRLDDTAAGLLAAFFAAYTLAAIAGGFALLVGERLPGRVTTDETRGTWVRGRGVATLGATVLAALVARQLLVDGTPGSFLALFAYAALALCVAAACTLALVERIAPAAPPPGLRIAPELPRLSAYPRYLAFRIVALLATVAEPFYVVYALRELNAVPDTLGTYLVAVVVARAVALTVGRFLARITGTRFIVQLGVLCRVLAAAAAIALPALWDTALLAPSFLTDAARAGSFTLTFVLLGVAMGANTAGGGYLLDLLPPFTYPSVVARTNTILAVLSLALLGGGTLAQRYGITAVFVAALGFGLLALLVSGVLPELRRARSHAVSRTAAFPPDPYDPGR